MEFHPLADIFPLMTDGELGALAADIAANGLREPIHIYQGRILDGRNRFGACRRAQVEPRFVHWTQQGDPVAFVVSMNLHRRHLDESQRALVAGKLAALKQGRPSHVQAETTGETAENEDQENTSIEVFSPPKAPGVTIRQAAMLLNVSRVSVERARRVHQHGHEDLVAAVEAGQVSVSDAAKVAYEPPHVQKAVVEAVKSGDAKTAAEAAQKIIRQGSPPDAPPLATDALGIPVYEAFRAVFATRDLFQAVARQLDATRRAVEDLAESPGGFYLRKELQHLVGKFKEIKYVVTHTAPHTVAPAKRNEPKWVSEIVWRTLSDEERGAKGASG